MTDEVMVQQWETLPGNKGMTIADALDWCLRKGLDPEQVQVTGGHLKWERPQTDEERQRRQAAFEATEARHKEWVKNRYHELFPEGE